MISFISDKFTKTFSPKSSISYKIKKSIFFILNIFFFIIFNEVLILNFCGLDYNTNKRIKQREKKEYDQSENENTPTILMEDLSANERDSNISHIDSYYF